jgi:hypothetical protein
MWAHIAKIKQPKLNLIALLLYKNTGIKFKKIKVSEALKKMG